MRDSFLGIFGNHITPLIRSIWIFFALIKRSILRTDEKIINNYMKKYDSLKLHIGCGDHILDGWLNSDLDPVSKKIFHLNATWSFPFKKDFFNYIFSEHMIEHITYSQGQHMLSECFRVLKPGGKIRLTTPDFDFLVNLYSTNKTEEQLLYIKWFTDNHIPNPPFYKDSFVINYYMKLFGHQFIYDEQILHNSLEQAGFINITRYFVGESGDEELKGLENEGRQPPGCLRLESLVLEGTKP